MDEELINVFEFIQTRMHSSRMRTARLRIVPGGGREMLSSGPRVEGRCCHLVPGGGRGGGSCCHLVPGEGREVLSPGPGGGGEGGVVQTPLVLHSSLPPPPPLC